MSEENDLISAEDALEQQLRDELKADSVDNIDQPDEITAMGDCDETTEVSSDVEEKQVDEVEEKAKKFGHISKEDWIAQGRDPAKYKTPEEFNKTGEVIEQIYSLKKKVDQRDREIQALIEYQKRTAEREYAKAKQELEARLSASKDDMDVEGVAHYTRELTRLQDMEAQNQQNEYASAQRRAQEDFIERNAHWFNDRNPDLKARAIEIDAEIKDLYPNASLDELARKIEARMQYEYPERVLGAAKRNAPAIAPSSSSVNKTAVNKSSVSRTFQSLPQDLKDTFAATKRIVESMDKKEYTVQDFIEQLKRDGEI